jgi:hypothetical protein
MMPPTPLVVDHGHHGPAGDRNETSMTTATGSTPAPDVRRGSGGASVVLLTLAAAQFLMTLDT